MEPAGSRIDQTLTFGREKLGRRHLLFAAICAGVGLLSVLVGGDDPPLTVVGWGLIVFGVGLAGWEFSKTTRTQKPLLVLSPKGIYMHLEGATEFTIPWAEVRGVDSITVEGVRGATFDNVTVVLVTRDFYERVIHVDSFIRRGPGWDAIFIPRDSMVQVALHHEILPVTASDLLAAVEARYRAFGRQGR
ncbi:MAG TPA: STM3941 family protein [Bauldia sp.]|nr:STM3941 family protein [Bauldia sp.]